MNTNVFTLIRSHFGDLCCYYSDDSIAVYKPLDIGEFDLRSAMVVYITCRDLDRISDYAFDLDPSIDRATLHSFVIVGQDLPRVLFMLTELFRRFSDRQPLLKIGS